MGNGERQGITKADLLKRGERRNFSRCGVSEFWEGHFIVFRSSGPANRNTLRMRHLIPPKFRALACCQFVLFIDNPPVHPMRQSVQPHYISMNLAELTRMDEHERHGTAACDVGDGDGTGMRGRENVGLGRDVSPSQKSFGWERAWSGNTG